MKRFTLLIAALVGLCIASFAGDSKYSEISKKDLEAAIAAKQVTLLDVNGSDSYKEGHLPGAIDFEAKKTELASLLPSDKNALVVAYCGGPGCKAYKEGADEAAKLGYTNVKHFKEGLSGWKDAGLEIAK